MNKTFVRKINKIDKFYIVFSTIMTTLLGLVLPFSILIIFDRILPNQSTDSLFLLYAIILFAIFFDHYLKTQEEKVISLITKRYESDLTNNVFHAICNANINLYRKIEIGHYLDRIGTISEVKSFFGGELIKAFVNLMTSIITVLIIFVINVEAGITLLFASIILLISANKLSKKRIALLAIRSNVEGITNSKIIEIVSNPLDIKSRAMEYRFENIMESMINEREKHNIEYERLESSFNLVLSLIQQLSVTLVVVMCATAVIDLEITQGVMAAVILLTNRYFSPYQQVMQTYSRWTLNKLHLTSLCKLINLKESQSDNSQIEFSSILMKMRGIDFEFKKSNGYILKGRSGSGKSSIIRALTLESRKDDITFTLDKIDITKLDYALWKNSISKVDAYTCLIEGNIIENLTSFRPHLSNAAYALCESIGVTSQINQLKSGFYTQLKGNQQNPFPRQVYYCLLIIRALLADKKLILIDDFDLFFNKEIGNKIISTMENKATRTMFFIISNNIEKGSERITIINLDDCKKSNTKKRVA